jgi:hypothetical protein
MIDRLTIGGTNANQVQNWPSVRDASGHRGRGRPSRRGVSAQPAQAKTVLGPVDLNVYCSSIGYTGARLTAYNVYGWLCYDAGRTTGIHVEQACAGQYNNPAMRADFYSLNDPFSWYCYI